MATRPVALPTIFSAQMSQGDVRDLLPEIMSRHRTWRRNGPAHPVSVRENADLRSDLSAEKSVHQP